MGDFYRVGDTVLCHTFGSVKPFKAEVCEMSDKPGVPRCFRDRNGTLITPADIISFSHAAGTKTYRAKCVIIGGIIGGNWLPQDKIYTFKAATGLTNEEIATAAYSAMCKRWSTGRFVGVLP